MIQPPDKGQVASRLQPLTDLLAVALPKAAAEASTYFTEKAKPYNASAFNPLVRYELLILLQAQKYIVIEDCVYPVELNRVPNIGLQLLHDGIAVKILKSPRNGKLPVPQTGARVEYYNQQKTFEVDGMTGDLIATEYNVVYLWESNSEYKVVDFRLVCPKSGGYTRDLVDVYFNIPIPLIEAGPKNVTPKEESPRSDLDIRRPEDDMETGTNHAE